MSIKPVALLGDVLLDVVEADNPSHKYEVTERAVEEGVNVSDHMKEQPATVSISGIVVGSDASVRLEKLKQYQKNRELVTYINRIIYPDMAIESLDTSHSVDVGNGFSFNIQLKRVRIAKPKEVEIINVPPAVQTKAKNQKNAGTKQSTKTKKTKEDTKADLADKIRNYSTSSDSGYINDLNKNKSKGKNIMLTE